MPSILDRYIPHPDVADDHGTLIHAPAQIVYDVASRLDLNDIALIRAIFWARSKILRAAKADAPTGGLVEVTRALGWGTLEETPGRSLVMGAYTQPWEPNPVFRALPPSEFAAFHQPGFVKIAWTIEAEPAGGDRAHLRMQTRAVATDEVARRRFRAYWRKFGLGIRLIRILSLPKIRREAEQRHRNPQAPRRGVARRAG